MIGHSCPDGRSATRAAWLTPRLVAVVLVSAICALGAACSADSNSTTPPNSSGGSAGADGGDGSVTDGPKSDVKGDTKPDAPDAAPACVPKTCAQLGADCGSTPDLCGGKVDCGKCETGQICGGGGPNKCGTNPCAPKTCAQVSASCGFASDGCSLAIDCGGCTPPAVCGGTGKLNECGCSPKSCAQLGVTCGSVPDGCGAVKDCGNCPTGQTCGGGGPNLCGTGTCNPKTCSQMGASCGPVSDGCSKAIDCGKCTAPDTCGGAGKASQCGCTPKTCSQMSASCGSINNKCTMIDCGTCGTGETCGGAGPANQCGCTCSLPHASTSCAAGKCSVAKCDTGWGDCDGNPANGCEVDTNTTLESCGQCGNGCSFANASATCVLGKCVLGTCETNYADCNKDPLDGCEANLQSDANNCLTCGKVCPAPSGTPECKAGVCGVSNCNPGAGDCDGNSTNGCETNTTNSLPHCGACNNPCDLQNANSVCTASQCHIDTCKPGFANCDSNESNGCEINSDISTSHCGTCATVCPTPPFSSPTCVSGVCGINCNSGWWDCDSNATNGCEINIDTDVSHCGQCTTVCTAAHATPNCVSGQCAIASCDGGYADCDSNVTNGCEVNVMTDTSHCGTCAKDCHVPNAQVGCSTGTCQLQTCNSGYQNCDNQYDNGCEVNIAGDPQNCGTCGKVCDSTHGTATCTTGSCGINCSAGYANCDGSMTNGCEINLNNDTGNCGVCGGVCSNNNGTPACSSGNCLIACSAGFADCDGNPANGCEVNLNNDVNHCGSCPNVCNGTNGTPTCTAGSCGINCSTGFGNCDSNASNGCEINLTNNVSHCGACPTVCNGTNGTPTCVGSACGINCNAGFGNCDTNPANGCEINLNTNTSHCGSCPNACNSTNGTATCTAGACGINCNAGFGNCDGNASNGCEINHNTNATRCGNCVTNCTSGPPPNTTSQTCNAGSCAVTCAGGWHNPDNAWANGCECTTDAVGDSCGAATNLGNVGLDGTLVYPTAPGYNTIGPSGDADFYVVTFSSWNCAYNPRITLVDVSGSGSVRMQVYDSNCSGAFACQEGGDSAGGNTDWQFNYQGTCGDLAPYPAGADPSPVNGYFITNNSPTFYIRVYSTNPSTTNCQQYRLQITN